MIRLRFYWRLAVAWLCALCLSQASQAQAEPVTTIRHNGALANRVDIVILGDGYTAAELASGKYATDVESFVALMFQQEPYREYQRYFNVHRVDVTSAESGADHPERSVLVSTALDATYNCGGIQRLICVNTTKVNAVLTASGIPANARESVLVLVNDAEYGGSGGAISVSSTHVQAVEIILHELGHSFALLADEYGGPPPPSCDASIEPSQVNAARDIARATIKWAPWVAPTTALPTTGTATDLPGAYQGARYCDTGLYRPTYNSKMRSLGRPFETINREQHVRRIYNFVSPIDTAVPTGVDVPYVLGTASPFALTVPQPLTRALSVVWRVDGVVVGTGPSYNGAGLSPGLRRLEATVSDATPWVRSAYASLLSATRQWNVNVLAPPSPFTRLAPSDATTGQPGTVTLSWQAAAFATRYEYCVDTLNNAFCDTSWISTGSSTSVTLSGLSAGTIYYWHVRAWNAVGMTGATGEAWRFQTQTGTAAIASDLAIDFGDAGLWAWTLYAAGTASPSWSPLHGANPSHLAVGDLDGNGADDLIVAFPGFGIWAWINSAGWLPIHQIAPRVIRTGDLDGNGKAEVVIDFEGYGLWARFDDGRWAQLQASSPTVVAVGNIDDTARADVVVSTPSNGVSVIPNNAASTPLHPREVTSITLGDLDANGRDDLVFDFPGLGLWIRYDVGAWQPLHPLGATAIATGDIDGDPSRRDDVIVDFRGYGVWAWMNQTAWVRLHPLDASHVETADLDGNGQADVVLSFPGLGVWIWHNNAVYLPLHARNPDGVVVGRFAP